MRRVVLSALLAGGCTEVEAPFGGESSEVQRALEVVDLACFDGVSGVVDEVVGGAKVCEDCGSDERNVVRVGGDCEVRVGEVYLNSRATMDESGVSCGGGFVTLDSEGVCEVSEGSFSGVSRECAGVIDGVSAEVRQFCDGVEVLAAAGDVAYYLNWVFDRVGWAYFEVRGEEGSNGVIRFKMKRDQDGRLRRAKVSDEGLGIEVEVGFQYFDGFLVQVDLEVGGERFVLQRPSSVSTNWLLKVGDKRFEVNPWAEGEEVLARVLGGVFWEVEENLGSAPFSPIGE